MLFSSPNRLLESNRILDAIYNGTAEADISSLAPRLTIPKSIFGYSLFYEIFEGLINNCCSIKNN